MAFQPEVNQELVIDDTTYRIAEHPVARGMPYGQEGRAAVVYQLAYSDDMGFPAHRAIKVFKPRFREPGLVALSSRLASFADIPGLSVCRRTVLSPQSPYHAYLIRQYPDLIYAVLMPWIDGPTWMEVLLDERELTKEQSLHIARSLCSILHEMESRGLAHCDLSGPNVIIPLLAPPDHQGLEFGTHTAVALVDVEQMYGPGLSKPSAISAGSSGYAHRSSVEGLWSANADRFSGAVLLSEMLGWCDERVRKGSWGENYFDPTEMQKETESYNRLHVALKEQWGDTVAELFSSAWRSETLVDCPSFEEWQSALLHVSSDLAAVAPVTPGGQTVAVAPAEGVAAPVPVPLITHASDQTMPYTVAAAAPAATSEQPPPSAPAKPRLRLGWSVLVPALLVLLALFAGSFVMLQGQSGTSPATPTSTSTTQPTIDLTVQARANASATTLALATRYPGAISPATVGSLRLLGTLRGHTGPVLSIAVSPNGLLFASASADGTVRLWKRSDGSTLGIFTGHTAPVTSVSFSPNGKTLASASVDKTVRFWNTEATAGTSVPAPLPGNTPPVVATPNRILSVAAAIWMAVYSFGHDTLALAIGDSLQLYDPGSDTPSVTLPGTGVPVKRVRFAPDDETIASGADDGTLMIWRAGTAALIRSLHDHIAAINDIAFSPDGALFATASEDKTIKVYHAVDGRLAFTLQGHTGGVKSIAFSPDSQTLASGGADNTLRLWNMSDGSLMRTLNTGTTLNSLAFTPDGTELVAGAEDATVMVWGTDAASMEPSPTPAPTDTAAATATASPVAPTVTVPAAAATTTATAPPTITRPPLLPATRTRTIVPTRTPTPTPRLLTPTKSPTRAVVLTSTPLPHTPTATHTAPPALTSTPTRLAFTPTHTAAPTFTPTRRPTNTRTTVPTSTDTPTFTPVLTRTPRPTNTPTDTPVPTDTPTNTRVPTNTPTPTEPPTDTPTQTPTDTATPTPPPIPCRIYRLSASVNGCELTVTWVYTGDCAPRGSLTGVVRGAAGPYLNDSTITPDSSPYLDGGPGQCGQCTISYRLTLYNLDGTPVSASTSVNGYTCIP